jgi:hypothetical protein
LITHGSATGWFWGFGSLAFFPAGQSANTAAMAADKKMMIMIVHPRIKTLFRCSGVSSFMAYRMSLPQWLVTV